MRIDPQDALRPNWQTTSFYGAGDQSFEQYLDDESGVGNADQAKAFGAPGLFGHAVADVPDMTGGGLRASQETSASAEPSNTPAQAPAAISSDVALSSMADVIEPSQNISSEQPSEPPDLARFSTAPPATSIPDPAAANSEILSATELLFASIAASDRRRAGAFDGPSHSSAAGLTPTKTAQSPLQLTVIGSEEKLDLVVASPLLTANEHAELQQAVKQVLAENRKLLGQLTVNGLPLTMPTKTGRDL